MFSNLKQKLKRAVVTPSATSKKGVLIVNLGSPDSPTAKDVKPYLDEFLMDERVIDLPLWVRNLVVRGIILNVRPKKSAEAYEKIWWDEGAPLIVITQRLLNKLRQQVPYPIEMGMRYGNPSIEAGLRKLTEENPGLEEVFLVPLYPHYAMSSYETVVVKAQAVAKAHFPHLKMTVQEPFFDEESYLNALVKTIKPHLQDDFEHFLFSYHGVPERHIKKGDPTKCHCLKVDNCCEVPSEAHAVCYRHQVMETSHKVAAKLGLSRDQYTVSFQSRLGPDPWLKPATDDTLEALGKKGVKNLKVACPAFVADCLETIEEIGMEGKEEFQEAGGGKFTMIPCLNDQGPWVKVLAQYIEAHFARDREKEMA
jgi:protoporphyrin/coproporphyrin ferrochelatase